MKRIHLVPVGSLPAGTLQELEPGLTRAFGAACSVDPEGLDSRFAYHPERQQHHATEILGRLAFGPTRGHGPAGGHDPPGGSPSPAGGSTFSGTSSPGGHVSPDARGYEAGHAAHAGTVASGRLLPEQVVMHPGTGAPPAPAITYPGAWRVLGVTAADLYIPILTFVFGEAQLEGRCAVVSMHRLRQEFYGLPPDAGLLAERLLKEAVHELGHTLGLVHCPDHTCAMASSHGVELIDVKSPCFCPACATAKETPAFEGPSSSTHNDLTARVD